MSDEVVRVAVGDVARTGETLALPAGVGQVEPLVLAGFEERLVVRHLHGGPLVGVLDVEVLHLVVGDGRGVEARVFLLAFLAAFEGALGTAGGHRAAAGPGGAIRRFGETGLLDGAGASREYLLRHVARNRLLRPASEVEDDQRRGERDPGRQSQRLDHAGRTQRGVKVIVSENTTHDMDAPDDIVVLLYDGFDELDAIAPYEVFRNAELPARYATLDPRERVTASHGTRVEPDAVLEPDDAPDLTVVPGGGWNDRSTAGAWAEAERGAIPERLAALHETGTTVAAVCTGAMLLARAGLLDGRPAVTHHGALDALRETDADVVDDARVVDAGDVLTAGGVTSGLDLALYLVERWAGPEIANDVSAEMEYSRVDRVYRA